MKFKRLESTCCFHLGRVDVVLAECAGKPTQILYIVNNPAYPNVSIHWSLMDLMCGGYNSYSMPRCEYESDEDFAEYLLEEFVEINEE